MYKAMMKILHLAGQFISPYQDRTTECWRTIIHNNMMTKSQIDWRTHWHGDIISWYDGMTKNDLMAEKYFEKLMQFREDMKV